MAESNSWQPIETVPERKRVMLFDPERPFRLAVFIGQVSFDDAFDVGTRLYEARSSDPPRRSLDCTHWMPIPEAPKS